MSVGCYDYRIYWWGFGENIPAMGREWKERPGRSSSEVNIKITTKHFWKKNCFLGNMKATEKKKVGHIWNFLYKI